MGNLAHLLTPFGGGTAFAWARFQQMGHMAHPTQMSLLFVLLFKEDPPTFVGGQP